MEEQSDTPRTDATQYQWTRTLDLARDLERELATATRERDEARAIANDRDAMVDHRDRALTAMYQRVDVITQERDEAIAEVERLRAAINRHVSEAVAREREECADAAREWEDNYVIEDSAPRHVDDAIRDRAEKETK